MEMGRALRFQAGLPLKYWGDCVHAAAHITSRLPCVILGDKTPYEVLHNEKPTYDNLRSVGCLAMASNPNLTTNKLDARGIPCIFMGYSRTQKGYKLIILINGQEFVSRDVKFYENIFAYHVFHIVSVEKEGAQNTEKSQKWITDDDEVYVTSETAELEEEETKELLIHLQKK